MGVRLYTPFMLTLFPATDPVLPSIDGLNYVPDFLTKEEDDRLLALIEAGEWNTQWSRRTQSYGSSYDGTQSFSKEMPYWADALAERLYKEGLTPILCNTMLINEYLPGQGIAPHVDYHPYDRTVVSISLGSPCIMDLEHVEGYEKHEIWLDPCSALIMDGESRYEWKHGIAARKKDSWNGAFFQRGRRVSMSFRKKRSMQYAGLGLRSRQFARPTSVIRAKKASLPIPALRSR